MVTTANMRLSYQGMFVSKVLPTSRAITRTQCKTWRSVSSSAPSTFKDEDVRLARQWMDKFDADTIPKRISELSFSRSSGPGGQNVNKVNSKATLRVPLEQLLPHVPQIFHQTIRAHRAYSSKSDSLIIQSEDSRKQSDNIGHCYQKLDEIIKEIGAEIIPGETSEEKKKHVRNMIKAGNEARIKSKKAQSSKKSSRRSPGGD